MPWFIIAYLLICWSIVEMCQYTADRQKLLPLNYSAGFMLFFFWPLMILTLIFYPPSRRL